MFRTRKIEKKLDGRNETARKTSISGGWTIVSVQATAPTGRGGILFD